MIEKLEALADGFVSVDNPDHDLPLAVVSLNVRIGLVLDFVSCALWLFKGELREPLLIYQWRCA